MIKLAISFWLVLLTESYQFHNIISMKSHDKNLEFITHDNQSNSNGSIIENMVLHHQNANSKELDTHDPDNNDSPPCFANINPMLVCADGNSWLITMKGGVLSNWTKCGQVLGGRVLCPSTWPYMCNDQFCMQRPDECTSRDYGHGGLRDCDEANSTMGPGSTQLSSEPSESKLPHTHLHTHNSHTYSSHTHNPHTHTPLKTIPSPPVKTHAHFVKKFDTHTHELNKAVEHTHGHQSDIDTLLHHFHAQTHTHKVSKLDTHTHVVKKVKIHTHVVPEPETIASETITPETILGKGLLEPEKSEEPGLPESEEPGLPESEEPGLPESEEPGLSKPEEPGLSKPEAIGSESVGTESIFNSSTDSNDKCWANSSPYLTCADGSEWLITLPGGLTSNWTRCGTVLGGKKYCPSTWPYMCLNQHCVKEPGHCSRLRIGHGGLKPCSS